MLNIYVNAGFSFQVVYENDVVLFYETKNEFSFQLEFHVISKIFSRVEIIIEQL
jgi:hypothetical protein